jgi:hypothetical protein
LAHSPRLTQDGLAGRLAARGVNLDRSALARVEKCRRYVLDYEAAAIAHALNVPIERLFMGSDRRTPRRDVTRPGGAGAKA